MMQCPVCATEMDQHVRRGVTIDHCPACGGVWLENGELDHLVAAVRPAVHLAAPNPEPDPAPGSSQTVRPAPEPRRDPVRGARDAPQKPVKRARFEAPAGGPRARPGMAHRDRRGYSRCKRVAEMLEEEFDFD